MRSYSPSAPLDSFDLESIRAIARIDPEHAERILAEHSGTARPDPFVPPAAEGSLLSEMGYGSVSPGTDFPAPREPQLPPSNLYDATRLKFSSLEDEARLRQESDALREGRDRPAGSQWVGDDLFTADGKLYATRLAGGLVVHRNSLLNMEKGADLVMAAERRYVEAKRKTPEGFFDALLSEDDLWSTLPFLGMVADIGGSLYTAKKISDINEKVRNGEQLTVDEAVALKYYMEDVDRRANKKSSVGSVAGDIVRRAPGFMIEFWATGGLGSLARTAAAHAAAKAAATAAGAAAASGVRRLAVYGVNRGAKTFARELADRGLTDIVRKGLADGGVKYSQAEAARFLASSAGRRARLGVERGIAASIRPFVAESLQSGVGAAATDAVIDRVATSLAKAEVRRRMAVHGATGGIRRAMAGSLQWAQRYASKAVLDWGTFGDAPETMLNYTFNSAGSALASAVGVGLVEAPIKGAIQYGAVKAAQQAILRPFGAAPVSANELSMKTNALRTGNKALYDAGWTSIGSEMLEYISENSGGMFAPLGKSVAYGAGGAVHALRGTKAPAVAARYVGEIGGLFTEEAMPKAGMSLARILERRIGTKDEIMKAVRQDQAGALKRLFAKKGLAATDAELEAFARSRNAAMLRDVNTRDFVTGLGPDYYRKLLGEAASADLAAKSYAAKVGGFFRVGAADFIARHQLGADDMTGWLRRVGYDGFIEEMLEERYSGFASGLLGLDAEGTHKFFSMENLRQAFRNVTTDMGKDSGLSWEEQLTAEAIGFAMPGLLRTGFRRAIGHVAGGQSELERVRHFARDFTAGHEALSTSEMTAGGYFDSVKESLADIDARIAEEDRKLAEAQAAYAKAGAEKSHQAKSAKVARDEVVRVLQDRRDKIVSHLRLTVRANAKAFGVEESDVAKDADLAALEGIVANNRDKLMMFTAYSGASKTQPVYSDEQARRVSDARDDAAKAAAEIGRVLDRSRRASGTEANSAGRRFAAKVTGILGALITGDISLAQGDPAGWALADAGVSRPAVAALANLHAQEFENARKRLVDAESRQPSGRGAKAFTNEEIEAEMDRDGTYATRAAALVPALMVVDGARMFHRSDVRDQVVMHLATKEGWSYDPKTKEFTRGAEHLAFAGFARRGQTDAERDANEKEVDDLTDDVSRETMRIMTSGGQFMSFRGFGREDSGLMTYLNLPPSALDKDSIALSIAADLAGFSDAVKTRKLADGVTVDSMVDSSSKHLPADAVHRVAEAANSGQTPDEVDVAMVAAAYGADLASLPDEWREKARAEVVRICRLVDSQDSGKEARVFVGRLENLGGPVLWDDPSYQVVFERKADGLWHATTRASAKLTVQGKDLVTASFTDAELDKLVKDSKLTETTRKIVVTDVTTLTTDDASLMLLKLGGANDHVSTCTKLAADGQPDYSCVHPRFRPRPGKTAAEARAEAEAELREEETLASLYDPAADGNLDYFNWGKELDATDREEYEKVLTERRNKCRAAYNAYNAYMSDIESRLRAAGVSTPTSDTLVNMALGVRERQYVCPIGMWAGITNGNQYIAADFRRGQDAQSAACMAIVDDAVRRHGALLRRGGAMRGAVAEFVRAVDNAARDRIVDLAEEGKKGSREHEALVELRRGLLGDAVAETLPRRTLAVLASAYGLGQAARAKRNGYCSTVYDPALLAIEDKVMKLPSYLTFLAYVDVTLGGDGLADFATELRLRRAAAAHPERAKLSRGERGLSRMLSVLRDAGTAAAATADVRPAGMSVENFAAGVANAAFNYSRDREAEKPQQRPQGNRPTWTDYRAALLDAFEKSGILDDLGQGTDIELNERLRARIEGFLGRLVADGSNGANANEKSTLESAAQSTLAKVTNRLANMGRRIVDLKGQLAESGPQAKADLEAKISNLMDATNYLAKEMADLAEGLRASADKVVVNTKDPAAAQAYVDEVNKTIEAAEKAYFDARAAQATVHGGKADLDARFGRVVYAESAMSDAEADDGADPAASPAEAEEAPAEEDDSDDELSLQIRPADIEVDTRAYDLSESETFDGERKTTRTEARPVGDSAVLPPESVDYLASTVLALWRVRNGAAAVDPSADDVVAVVRELTSSRIADADARAVAGSVAAILKLGRRGESATGFTDGVSDAAGETTSAANFLQHERNVDFLSGKELTGFLHAAELVSPATGRSLPNYLVVVRQSLDALVRSAEETDEELASKLRGLVNMLRPRTLLGYEINGRVLQTEADVQAAFDFFAARFDEIVDVDAVVAAAEANGAMSVSFLVSFLKSLESGARRRFLDLVASSAKAGAVAVDKTVDPVTGDSDAAFTLDADPRVNATGFSDGLALASFSKILDMDREQLTSYLERYFGAYDEQFGVYSYAKGFKPSGPIDVVEIFSGLFGCESPILLALSDERVRSRPSFAKAYAKCVPTAAVYRNQVLASETASALRALVQEYLDRSTGLDRAACRDLLTNIVLARAQSGMAPRENEAYDHTNPAKSANRTSYFRTLMYEYARYMTPAVANGRTIGSRNRSPSSKVTLILRGLPPLVSKFLFAPRLLADGTANHRSFAAMALRMWANGRKFQDYAPDLSAVDPAHEAAVRDAQAALDGRASLDDARRRPYEEALEKAKADYAKAVAAAPRVLAGEPVPYAALSAARRAEVDAEFDAEVLPSLRQDVCWPDGTPVVVKSLDVDRTDGETVGAAARSAKGLFGRVVKYRKQLADALSENNPVAMAARAEIARLKPEHDRLKAELDKARSARDELQRAKAPDYLLKPAEAAFKAAQAAFNAVDVPMSTARSNLNILSRNADVARLNVSIALSGSYYVPLFHGDHATRDIMRIPASLFDAECGAPEEMRVDPAGNPDAAYHKIARVVNTAISLDMLGDDTKRAALSSNESVGTAMRGIGVDANGNETWGENRLHVLMDFALDKAENDAFIGSIFSVGYAVNAQSARAKRGELRAQKTHVMSGWGDKAAFVKGLTVSSADRTGRFANQAVKDIDEYLRDFRKGTVDRSTSSAVDRDALKVGPLVSTTLGVASPEVAALALSDPAAAAARVKELVGLNDKKRPAYGNLYDHVFERLDALEARGEDIGTLSGEALDKALCDRRDAGGNPVADEDGVYRFTWVEAETGREPTVRRVTVAEALGCTDADADPESGAAVQVRVVKALTHKDGKGVERRTLDFSYVDNGAMSYAVANVAHDARLSTHRLPRNHAIDILTYASGQDGAAAKNLMKLLPRWGLLAGVVASGDSNVFAALQSSGVRERLAAGTAPGSGPVQNEAAYNVFANVRHAMNPPINATYAPLVSAGAVYRDGVVHDHSKDPFFRAVHRGATVFGKANRERFGAKRRLGYCHANINHPSVRYMWFVDGATKAEQAETLRRAATAVEIELAAAARAVNGDSAEKPAAAPATDDHVALIERLFTLYKKLEGYYTTPGRVLTAEEKKAVAACLVSARRAVAKAFVDHHGRSVLELRAVSVSASGETELGRAGSVAEYVVFEDLFREDGKFDRTAIDSIPAPAEVDGSRRERTCLGGSMLGCPRTPSYNGFKWMQGMRIATPVTEVLEEDGSYTAGREAMISPDAQTLYILGCDHDGDKSLGYMLRGGRYGIVSKMKADDLDPAKFGLDVNATPVEIAAKIKDPAIRARFRESQFVEAASADGSRPEGLTDKAKSSMSNAVVASLFDMIRDVPCTVDGQEVEADRTFADTDYGRPTTARPISGEARWKKLLAMANAAFNFRARRGVGLEDSDRGVLVGDSASGSDKARGIAVSLAQALHLAYMSRQRADLFGPKDGDFGRWIDMIHFIDGISNATFDDVKEQICLRLGVTPGMADILYGDLLFGVYGRPARTEDEFYDVLSEYVGSLHDGAGLAMLLSSDVSESDVPYEGLSLGDMFRGDWADVLAEDLAEGYAQEDARRLPYMSGEAAFRVQARHSAAAVKAALGRLVGRKDGVSQADVHRIVRRVVFGTGGGAEATRRVKRVRELFGLAPAKGGLVYTKKIGGASRLAQARAEFMKALDDAASAAKNPHSVLKGFARQLAENDGCSALGGYVSGALFDIAAAPESERADIAEMAAARVFDIVTRGEKIRELKRYSGLVNCFKAEPSDARKMANRGRIVSDFVDWQDNYGRDPVPADVRAMNATLFAGTVAAYDVPDVQTLLGRLAVAQAKVDETLVNFAGAVQSCPGAASVGNKLVARIFAAPKWGRGDILAHETTYLRATNFLAAVWSQPETDAASSDIMSTWPDVFATMRAIAQGMAEAPTLSYQRAMFTRAKPDVLRPLDRALLDERAERWARDTVAFQQGVVRLFGAFYALVSLSDESVGVMAAAHRFGVVDEADGDIDDAQERGAADVGNGHIAVSATSRDRNSVAGMRRAMERMLSQDFTKLKRHKARVDAHKPLVDSAADSFCLTIGNLVRFLRENTLDEPTDTKNFRTSDMAFGTGIPEVADKDQIRLDPPPSDDPCQDLVKLAAWCEALVSANPDGERGSVRWQADAAASILILLRLADAHKIDPRTISISPKALFEQLIPVYSTTVDRVDPGKPSTRSLVGHIPGACERITQKQAELDSPFLDLGQELPAGLRLLDLVAMCNSNRLLEDPYLSVDSELEAALRNPDVSKRPRDPRRAVDEAKLTDRAASDVAQLLAENVDEDGNPQPIEDLQGPLHDARIVYSPEWRAKRSTRRGSVYDVLNDGGIMENLCEWTEIAECSPATGHSQPPSAQQAPARPAGPTQPEVASLVAYLRSCVGDTMDVRYDGGFTFTVESKGRLAGSAAALFGLGAKELGAKGAPRAVITFDFGTAGSQASAAELDVNSPAVAASFCHVFNSTYGKRINFNLTTDQFFRLTETERRALVSRVTAGGFASSSSFALARPSWSIDEQGVLTLAGHVSLADADARTALHEYFHSMTGIFASIGMFTEADLAVLRSEFGDAPAKSGFLFNEEAAADAFADWTMRNTTRRDGTPGERVARGVGAAVRRIFERIQQFFRALWQLFGRDGGFTFDTSAPTSVSRRVSTREKMFGLVLNGYAPVTAARARALGLVKGEADFEAQTAALSGKDREDALATLRKRSTEEGGLPYSENELLSRLSAAELRDNIEFARLFADEHERVRFADRRADDAVAAAQARADAGLAGKAKKNPTELQEDYEALAVSGSKGAAEARLRRTIDARTANRVLRTMREDARAGLRRSFDLGRSLVDELGRAGPLRLDVVRQLVQRLVSARGGAVLGQARRSADTKLAKSAEADEFRWSVPAAPAPRAAGPYAATYADIMAKNDETLKLLGEWSVNEDTSVGLVYSPLRYVLGGLRHGDNPALVKAAGAARDEAEREFAGRVGVMQDLDRAVAKARHDYHAQIVKRGLALAGLDPKAAEDTDSYNMVMSVAHLLRRGRGQFRHKYTVQGGGVRIAGKRQIRVSSSDVAGAIKAANGQPFGMAVADAMADIAKMMNGIPASERGTKPGEGSATWRTGVKLFNGLADVLAQSDVTLLAEGSRTWDDAVDKFFAYHIVGVSPAPTTGAERGPFWSNSNESTLEAVENRKIYALGTAKGAAPDAARELRQRMLERAVSAVLVAAAQVKFSRELGIPAGAVHHNRFIVKAQSAPDFAALSDVLGIGVNHATSDDPLVAEFNTPTFVAVHIGSWLSSTVQSKLGNCDLKRLFMRESQSLIGDVDVIVNAVNRVDQMFGMDRRVGAAVGKLAKRKATHVWGDSGFIEPAGENAPEYEGVDNLGLRSGHRLSGVRHYLRGVTEDVALDEDDARLIDALMKCAWAKLRGGRSLVTGAQMTFAERDLYRPRSQAEIDAGKKPVPIDETDLSREALESWFIRMTGGGDVRQMPGFMLALRNFDQQWNTEPGSNLELDHFRNAVVQTIVRAARDWAHDVVRVAAAGPGDFCDFVIRRLVKDDLAVATSERDGAKNSDGETLLTKCTLAIPVSYINAAWEKSETKRKLVDEAGRDPAKLTLDWAVAQIEAPLRQFHVHLADKPWLSRGDARYLNNYGSMLRTFSGNGVFMMNALKAERDVVAEATARVGRHEETLMRMLDNERVMNAPADTMTGAMLAMVHDYFGTAEEGEDLREAIRDGRYSAGSMASVRTGLVLPWNATCKDVARQIYARLLDVKMRALEGRPAERGAVDDDAAAVGRMIRAYEAAADAGQPLSGGFGMTDEAAYQLNGALPASMTLGHAAINATRGLQAALYHRSVLVNMLSTPGPEGMPLYFANPSADAVETSGIPDEVWEAITRHNAKKLGAEGVDVAYDPTLSGVENARRIYDVAKSRFVATNGRIFGKGYKALAAEQLGSSKSIVEILCRAPTGGSNEDKLAMMAGGEAAGYARQLFEIGKMLDCGYGNVTMQALNHIMAWSKTMKVSFSAFFPWATRWESPTAACGALATILGNMSPKSARRLGKAMEKLKRLGAAPAWADESFLGTRDVLEMMDTDDPFLSDLIVWAESLGITMTSRVVNPNDGAEHHVQKDVQNLSDMIERSAAKGLLPKGWAKAAGEAVKIAYGTLLERQGEKAFTYAMNATKLAVAAQVALRLKNEAMRTGRAFDPVRDMAGMAEYVDSEIGGVNPVRYAWATPGFRRLMNFMLFSWQWTRTAWEAGGGGILEDMLFGGHHVTAEQRRFTAVRWLRMWAVVMYGLPAVIQLASKSMALLLAGIDDDDDPWMAWNNETKVGWTAANIRPLLKMTAKWDATVSAMFGYGNGWKDRKGLPTGYIANLKRHGNPLVALVPMYTGLDPYGRISDEPLYVHAAKQGWEVVRWGKDPWGQILSKLSMPMQAIMKALSVVSDFAGGTEDARKNNSLDGKPRSSLWNVLSPGRAIEALAGPVADVFAPFSTSAFTTNSDAGLIGLALPVQRSASYTNIKDRMESLIEHRVYNDAKMYAAGRENLRRQTRKPSVRIGVPGVKKLPKFERAEWPDSDFQRRTGGFRDDVARTILEDARKMGMSKQTFAYALQEAMRGVRVRLVNRLVTAMPKTTEDTYSPDRIRYLARCLYRSGYTHSALFDRVRETFGTRGGVKSWADVDPGLKRRIAEIDRTLLRRPLFDARPEYRAETVRYNREMNEILKAESSAGRR